MPELRKWVLGTLGKDATTAERARHAMPLGTWDEQAVIDDSWDREAAGALQWALGLDSHLSAWDDPAEWGSAIEEFYDFPQPDVWHPELKLRDPDALEEAAQSYEVRLWFLRTMKLGRDEAYAKKLLRRAADLGQVQLSSDGFQRSPMDPASLVRPLNTWKRFTASRPSDYTL